jgi:hypothetical protein
MPSDSQEGKSAGTVAHLAGSMPGEAAASRELDDEWGKLIRRKSVESEHRTSERLEESEDLASAPQRVASGGSQTLPGRRKTAALRTLSTGSQRRAPSTHASVRFTEPDTVQPDPAGLSDDDESTPLHEELEDADMPISRAASSGDSDGWNAPEYDSDGDYAPGAPPAPPAAKQCVPRPAPRAPRPAPRAPRLVLAGDWGPDPWLRAQGAVAAGGEGAPPRTKWTRLVHPSVLTGHVPTARSEKVRARRKEIAALLPPEERARRIRCFGSVGAMVLAGVRGHRSFEFPSGDVYLGRWRAGVKEGLGRCPPAPSPQPPRKWEGGHAWAARRE